jgi:hypothetical protein
VNADHRVLLDSCVLANFAVCDLLLRLSEHPRVFLPRWSETILDEVHRTHVKKLGWNIKYADSFQCALRTHFPEACVRGYEKLIPVMENDEKDRHVLAAAIIGGCSLILTFNLKHFPESALKDYSVEARHPQDYLQVLYELERERVVSCLGEIAGRKKKETQDVLIELGKALPKFSQRLLDDLGMT